MVSDRITVCRSLPDISVSPPHSSNFKELTWFSFVLLSVILLNSYGTINVLLNCPGLELPLSQKRSKIKLPLNFLLTHTFSDIFISPFKIWLVPKIWSVSKFPVNIKFTYSSSNFWRDRIPAPVTQSCCFHGSLLNVDSLSWSLWHSSVRHTCSEVAAVISPICDSFRNEKYLHPERAPFSSWQNS